jgi:hypothetical protein
MNAISIEKTLYYAYTNFSQLHSYYVILTSINYSYYVILTSVNYTPGLPQDVMNAISIEKTEPYIDPSINEYYLL